MDTGTDTMISRISTITDIMLLANVRYGEQQQLLTKEGEEDLGSNKSFGILENLYQEVDKVTHARSSKDMECVHDHFSLTP